MSSMNEALGLTTGPIYSFILLQHQISSVLFSNFGCNRELKPILCVVCVSVCACVHVLLLLLLSAPRVSIALRLFMFVCAYSPVCFHMFMLVHSNVTPVFQTYTCAPRRTLLVQDVRIRQPVPERHQTVLNIIYPYGELAGGSTYTVSKKKSDLPLKGSSQNDQIIRIKGINCKLLDCMFFLREKSLITSSLSLQPTDVTYTHLCLISRKLTTKP